MGKGARGKILLKYKLTPHSGFIITESLPCEMSPNNQSETAAILVIQMTSEIWAPVPRTFPTFKMATEQDAAILNTKRTRDHDIGVGLFARINKSVILHTYPAKVSVSASSSASSRAVRFSMT